MGENRVKYFDLARGVAIILVVLGHMEGISEKLSVWISSFHMPLFFVISGMLIAMKNEDKADNIIRKKAKGLLIPYMWFSLIYVPIDIMNLCINHIDAHTFFQNLLDSLTFSGITVMWFLPALFIAQLAAVYEIKCAERILNKRENNKLAVSFAGFLISIPVSVISYLLWEEIRVYYDANVDSYLIATLLGFVRVILRGMFLSVHVTFGYIFCRIINLFEKKKGMRILPFAAGLVFFGVNLSLCFKNAAVDNHLMNINSLPIYYICAFSGSLAIILICKGINSIRFIDFLGKNSLIIMATHLQCYILYAGILIAIAIDAHVTRAKSYVYVGNTLLFTMLIESVLIIIINRYFAFITGKEGIKDSFNRVYGRDHKNE